MPASFVPARITFSSGSSTTDSSRIVSDTGFPFSFVTFFVISFVPGLPSEATLISPTERDFTGWYSSGMSMSSSSFRSSVVTTVRILSSLWVPSSFFLCLCCRHHIRRIVSKLQVHSFRCRFFFQFNIKDFRTFMSARRHDILDHLLRCFSGIYERSFLPIDHDIPRSFHQGPVRQQNGALPIPRQPPPLQK